MSDGYNKVILHGTLGADCELREAGSTCVCKFRLATNESYKDKAGTWQKRTEWHSCTLWGKRGEGLQPYLTKGRSVFVEGSLHTSSYEKDGEKRYRTEINVSNVILGGGGEKREATGAAPTNDQNKGWNGKVAASFDYPVEDDDLPF